MNELQEKKAIDALRDQIRRIADCTIAGDGKIFEAVKFAEEAGQIVEKLEKSSEKIGGVVKAIDSIARQTKFLALNATIESARAGEAGKGFAVVAKEVKELSNETSNSTANISREIQAVQLETKQVVDIVGKLIALIKEVEQLSANITDIVKE